MFLKEFLNANVEFKALISDLDLRLSHILVDAFSDVEKLDDIFKFLTITGSLINRKIIMRNFEPNFDQMLCLFNEELDSTKILIDKQMSDFKAHRNLPTISGVIKFCNEIRNKITKPFKLLERLVSHPIIYSKEMKSIRQKHNEICCILNDIHQKPLKDWLENVDSNVRSNLNKNVIVRNTKDGTISKNFSCQVNKKNIIGNFLI